MKFKVSARIDQNTPVECNRWIGATVDEVKVHAEGCRCIFTPILKLDDTIELDAGVDPADVERSLIENVNLAWQQAGNEARVNVPANFVGWALQELEQLRMQLEAALHRESE